MSNVQLHLRLQNPDGKKFTKLCKHYGLSPSGTIKYMVHRCVLADRIPGIKPIK